METTLNRRSFIVNSSLALTGFVVAFSIPSPIQRVLAAEAGVKTPLVANAFIRIAPDNTITIVINRLEMGQGVNTSIAQLISEELECDWAKVQSVASDSDMVYNDPNFHMIMTGGSTSLANTWVQYRTLGAGMRENLLLAASKRWSVPVSELKAENGVITHKTKGKLTYGELAEEANKLPFPEKPTLKKKEDYKLIGKSQKRVDALAKSNGTAVFGMDIRLPGMLYATISRPSMESAKLQSFNEKAAKAIKGVTHVFKLGNHVAVVAKNTYLARQGQEALDVKWTYGDFAKTTSETLMKDFRAMAEKKGAMAKNDATVDEAMKAAAKSFTAEYEFPFLAHAPMEPMNCTINYDGKTAQLYGGFQMPTLDHVVAAKILGLKPENIKFNITYAGGSFGRRGTATSDYVKDSCELAKVLKKPVKVVWTREDDMRGGYYRPMVFHKVTVGLDPKNELAAWDHHLVGQSISKGTVMENFMIKNGVESALVEGVSDTHYDLKKMRVQQTIADTPLRALWWRSVGHTHTAYVMETMIDELATAAGQDPLEYRVKHLQKSPKFLAVLELLRKQTKWGKEKAPQGRAWGLAIHESFGSIVGHVAEVSLTDGTPRVHKVWSAVSCGQVVNPEGAKTQVESAIVFGLSAAFNLQIQLENGKIKQGNFDDYEVLRLQDMPEVSVAFVDSDEPPTGLGEPGVPAIAPAVANGLFKLNNKRLRKLPFSRELKA